MNLSAKTRLDDAGNQPIRALLREMPKQQKLDYASEWQGKLEKMPNNHPDRSHAWRMMTACRVHAEGISETTLGRIAGVIPENDKPEHAKRCAWLTMYLREPGFIDQATVETVFQPWFCRDWKSMANIEVVTHLPLIMKGHAGCCWWISHRVESDEQMGAGIGDLVENLTQACNQDRLKYGLSWTRVVGSGCDIWQQRTGIILASTPPVRVVRPLSSVEGWVSPRTVLNANADELRKQ